MPEIVVHENEPIEPALKRFKKECAKAGIFRELKSRRAYEKPSDRRRRERQASIRKAARRARKLRRRMERY
jgi:small subunit ribosomal protein S21